MSGASTSRHIAYAGSKSFSIEYMLVLIAFRVVSFPAGSRASKALTYTNQLAFTSPEVSSGNLIGASHSSVAIAVGQKTSLTSSSGHYQFSDPTSGESNYLIANNSCNDTQNMCLAAVNHNVPQAILYFDNVGQGTDVKTQFHPVLSAYITSDYQETEILKNTADIQKIWIRNLSELPENTTWIFEHDPRSGSYSLRE
ncbi:hypothetical protein FRC17_001339 [Serendipita sp. 399]|nr:hypothetical protein FRC17_001339 [Serendipita sp. 399]